ncbi:cystatin/monellin superfamily protein [Striga asiatica]|uniref:Cystatin/monellin superfamily protein n=1 Tax=Striga asiatica TaxID=4170 RepID=A0A5A7PP15_STRAF|nr:cystatin/monellin superfamily protein [Striga asiatica]
MPLTRSNKRKLMLEENNDKAPEKSKVPNNELSQKPKEGTAPLRSLENPWRGRMARYYSKRSQLITPEEGGQVMKYLTGKEIAESALCEYNNKHGTDLEFVRVLDGKETLIIGPGCRLDFADGSVASDPKLLSEDDAVKLSQFALKDYNEEHGTNLKFERAFGCNSFTCAGRLMDFTEKSTRLVHVNFEAMVGESCMERIRLMFAELYLGNDDKYVLATLLPAEPKEHREKTNGCWRDGYPEIPGQSWRRTLGHQALILLLLRFFIIIGTKMPLTRSSKRKLLREENNDKPSEKSKFPNNELSQKPKEGTAPLGSLRKPWRKRTPRYYSKRSHPITPEEVGQVIKYLSGKEIAESALCEYNNKHGTDLEFVRVLDGKETHIIGPGCRLDFAHVHCIWRHLNIEARRRSVGPGDEKPLLLFVESIKTEGTYALSTMSLVAPTDKCNATLYHCAVESLFYSYLLCHVCGYICKHRLQLYLRDALVPFSSNGCQKCCVASDPKLLSEDDAVKLSQFAVQDYNEKHGTKLKFERAFGCNSFTCAGRLMDLTEKSTRWVHVNFEAMVGESCMERIRLMFAELYLGNDDKYVLATLLPAEPEEHREKTNGRWLDGYPESECAICPNEIRHPWRAYRYCFNYPPNRLAWPVP